MFATHFTKDARSQPTGGDPSDFSTVERYSPGFTEFMTRHSGCSFDRGLYRVLPLSNVNLWNARVGTAFPQYSNKLVCFAFDWLGRCFALDATRQSGGELLVVLLEPGTGQALRAPVTFSQFHNQELVDYRNDSLASDFFTAWLENANQEPEMQECIGYKKPLFLGGDDTVANLEKTDMELYWSLCAQLLEKTRYLPDGTVIRNIDIV